MASSAAKAQVMRAVDVFEKASKAKFTEVLQDLVAPQIISTVMAEYDLQLVAAVTDRKSRTRPDLYRDYFLRRLEDFEFVRSDSTGLVLRTPDMDNFDFSGRLRIIENILNGTVGTYVEVDEDQYVQIYEKQPLRDEIFDPDVPKKERIYLLKLTIDVRQKLRSNNIDLIRFPFSNTPPIDIFSAADVLVEDNMNRWIEYAVTDARRTMAVKYGR